MLSYILKFPSSYYRTFNIPKRKGGYREICSPYPSLLYIQRWINNNILNTIPLEDNSHGFRCMKSIITNANQHLGTKALLKMDIENYFPSISLNRVIEIFQRCGYPNKISYYLSSFCCLNNSLPQGAATSPTLSNIVFKKADRRLNGLAKRWNLTYTRYADDLTFSGDYIPHDFSSYVTSIINDEGFNVNKTKTTLITKKGKKLLQEYQLLQTKCVYPEKKKREYRKEAHYLTKFGYSEHAE